MGGVKQESVHRMLCVEGWWGEGMSGCGCEEEIV